jgi:hypothetical protein
VIATTEGRSRIQVAADRQQFQGRAYLSSMGLILRLRPTKIRKAKLTITNQYSANASSGKQ